MTLLCCAPSTDGYPCNRPLNDKGVCPEHDTWHYELADENLGKESSEDLQRFAQLVCDQAERAGRAEEALDEAVRRADRACASADYWKGRFRQAQHAKLRAYALAGEMADKAYEAELTLQETAEWLQAEAFPFDWQTEEPPPELLYHALVQAWEHADGETYTVYSHAIADETGWPCLDTPELGDHVE